LRTLLCTPSWAAPGWERWGWIAHFVIWSASSAPQASCFAGRERRSPLIIEIVGCWITAGLYSFEVLSAARIILLWFLVQPFQPRRISAWWDCWLRSDAHFAILQEDWSS
jgi:hypothetical protein